VPAVCPAVDTALKEPCLDKCPNANRRRELGRGESSNTAQCPQALALNSDDLMI
jgi:hypothetical protein